MVKKKVKNFYKLHFTVLCVLRSMLSKYIIFKIFLIVRGIFKFYRVHFSCLCYTERIFCEVLGDMWDIEKIF